MTSSDAGDGIRTAEMLAALARDDTRGADERQQALVDLQPVVQQVARRVVTRFGGASSTGAVEEALGVVWEALGGYEPGLPFQPWCYRVLKNRLIDRVRQEQADWRRQREKAVSESVQLQEALEGSLERREPFAAGDLEELSTWPLPQRLGLLCLSGLWEKVPTAPWLSWVQEYKERHDAGLALPFPPALLQGAEDVASRNAILAGALGVRRNTLSVWLHRYKDRLANLACVRALLDTP
jgi:DNA-directed RNA polymerase specialized sigma24 family protein